jgi:hypothetical protein
MDIHHLHMTQQSEYSMAPETKENYS